MNLNDCLNLIRNFFSIENKFDQRKLHNIFKILKKFKINYYKR
jgi:hypothetical protein